MIKEKLRKDILRDFRERVLNLDSWTTERSAACVELASDLLKAKLCGEPLSDMADKMNAEKGKLSILKQHASLLRREITDSVRVSLIPGLFPDTEDVIFLEHQFILHRHDSNVMLSYHDRDRLRGFYFADEKTKSVNQPLDKEEFFVNLLSLERLIDKTCLLLACVNPINHEEFKARAGEDFIKAVNRFMVLFYRYKKPDSGKEKIVKEMEQLLCGEKGIYRKLAHVMRTVDDDILQITKEIRLSEATARIVRLMKLEIFKVGACETAKAGMGER